MRPFSLLEPVDDTVLNTRSPVFKWQKASSGELNLPWELGYQLLLDDNENFISPECISSIYDSTFKFDSLTAGASYFWKVKVKNLAGDSLWSSETNGFFVSPDATPVNDQTTHTKFQTFQIYPNYPNPFNSETTLRYVLPPAQASYDVDIEIYDTLGRIICVLVNEPETPGAYSVEWNGRNTVGAEAPSGLYICTVQAGQITASRKMLLVR